jgi:hypothetical protein
MGDGAGADWFATHGFLVGTLLADALPALDELIGNNALSSMGVGTTDGRWQNGTAGVRLEAVGHTQPPWLEVSEIRIVVDGSLALVLDGQALEALGR